MNNKLRIGLLLDNYQLPAWINLMVTRLAESEQAEIVLVVLNGATRKRRNFLDKLRSEWRTIPTRLVSRVLRGAWLKLMERVQFENNAFEIGDLEPLLRGVPTITVRPVQKQYSDYLIDDDISSIEAFQLDVLVRLGFRVLKGRILTAARYGVWSYHHGDNLVNRGGPYGFWETMESWPQTGSVLQILTEDLDGGQILYRSWSCTNQRSVTRNNNARFWTSASFLPRMIDRLGTVGDRQFFDEVTRLTPHPKFYCNRLYLKPSNKELSLLLFKRFLVRVKTRISRYFYFDQWCILFSRHPDIATSLRRFSQIVPPRDRFWADPNVVSRNELYYVYIEEFIYAREKGHISLIVMDREGEHGKPLSVIDEPHHLSYPFVFEFEKSLYMLAESSQARVVPLYRCTAFPDKWTFERNLFEDIEAVDPTLLFHNGKWFLFLGVAENRGSSASDELFLYFSDNPIAGTWTPHPLNPIISDVRRARPGGRIIARDGLLFRPSQNCSRHYGYGLNLSQITSLSESEYAERKVTAIEPKWNNKITGVHTLSTAHQLTVVDALLRRAKYW